MSSTYDKDAILLDWGTLRNPVSYSTPVNINVVVIPQQQKSSHNSTNPTTKEAPRNMLHQ